MGLLNRVESFQPNQNHRRRVQTGRAPDSVSSAAAFGAKP